MVDLFLPALVASGNVSTACIAADISRQTAYRWKREDEGFAAAWEDAMEQGCDTLEKEARRRAIEGVLEPVFYQGDECGAVRKYSDTLLIFLLKGHRPERFRERYEVTGKDGGPMGMLVAPAALSAKQWEAISRQNADSIQAAVANGNGATTPED